MLVLTRKSNESIMIGDNILITVLSVKGNQVKIGFDAPKDVRIYREEIFERIQKSKLVGVDTDLVKNDDC